MCDESTKVKSTSTLKEIKNECERCKTDCSECDYDVVCDMFFTTEPCFWEFEDE